MQNYDKWTQKNKMRLKKEHSDTQNNHKVVQDNHKQGWLQKDVNETQNSNQWQDISQSYQKATQQNVSGYFSLLCGTSVSFLHVCAHSQFFWLCIYDSERKISFFEM